ncbi:hypothetical protein K443DRAFT_658344 [Laccaria amethystina LaAM-08-1]|uniref:C3H1-type domain-containing protein n=1 Tax=Laccaria amethystina LaAM-08-1 TaxID=1095629 RepID=A0A0C9Y412_9AGAR|nr:hypothetical protein K443DRAFT_658344 [Laccaria amethystina LaAM-08-1]
MHKKYPCRYFDDNGHPLSPKCQQGKSCRFLHPDDPNWPGSSYDTPKSVTARRASYDPLNSAAVRPKYHSTPLVSQTDLFLRCKDVDDSAINDRVNMYRPSFRDASLTNRKKSVHRFDRRSPSRERPKAPKRVRDDFSPSRESTRAILRARDDHDFSFESKHVGRLDHQYQKAESRRDKNNKEFSQRPTLTSLTFGQDRPTGLDVRTPIAEKLLDNDKHQNGPRVGSSEEQGIAHIVQLFRELARLTSKVNQQKEAQRKEETNFQTYNDIASALSQIPNMVPTNISSSLADSLLKQAQYKQSVEESFEAIGNVWLDMIGMFKTEVSRTIDQRLEVALMSIKQEAANLYNSSVVKPGMSGKRWSEASTTSPSIDSREKGRSMNSSGGTHRPIEFDDCFLTEYRHGRTSYKRRRLAALSPTRKVEGSNREDLLDQTTLLSQMRSQIEQQAQTLENLSKENNRKRICH